MIFGVLGSCGYGAEEEGKANRTACGVGCQPAADRRSAVVPADESFAIRTHLSIVAAFHERRLPHYHAVREALFLTWRLYGSLPVNRNFPASITSGQAFVTMDRILDRGNSGPLFLRQPEIAAVMINALHYRESCLKHFELHAWVVMPNHVHLLITPLVPVSRLMHSLKLFTAVQANPILNRTGQAFWQRESYDRLVRDDREFERIVRYIEMNPVKAGLVAAPEQFPWSSAMPIDNRQQLGKAPHKE